MTIWFGARNWPEGVSMRIQVRLLVLSSLLLVSTAEASPIIVGGFTFMAGETAFADAATVVSGTVTGSTATQVNDTLAGSGVGDSIRVITPDVAVIEVLFDDNAIANGAGTDLVVFELSGAGTPDEPRPPGYADFNERFELSLFVAGAFTPFVEVVPVSTGVLAPHDSSLAIYAVEIDLDDFGAAPDSHVDRLQIRLIDHLVTRSADPTAFGALNSVPEPRVAVLAGVAVLTTMRRGFSWTRAPKS